MDRSQTIILDFQYLRGNNDQMIVKELAFIKADVMNIERFHFMPPFSINELTSTAKFTNDYCAKKINLLEWQHGNVPYTMLEKILKGLVKSG